MRAAWCAVAVTFALALDSGATAATPSPAEARALQAIEAGARASESDAVLVLRDGRAVLDYRRPGGSSEPIEMMSCTKSLVALGIGRLLTQGKLRSLDQPVADFYPEWKQGRKAQITLRMLLNHTSGLQNVPNTSVEIYPAPDGIKLALAAELSDPPGERWSYNNKAMNLLAGVIEQAAQERMDIYLQREVLEPIGIRGPSWNKDGGYDNAGHPYAMAGWLATAEGAARVGQLVLDEGLVGTNSLIDPAYMREMVAQSSADTPSYGLLWWRRSTSRTLIVDAAGIDKLAQAGIRADLLNKLRTLFGTRYPDTASLRTGLRAALGTDLPALSASAAEHRLSLDTALRVESGPVEAYTAEGYLGQYIVVVPSARIVAVRQIRERADWAGDRPWPYSDENFIARVLALAHAGT